MAVRASQTNFPLRHYPFGPVSADVDGWHRLYSCASKVVYCRDGNSARPSQNRWKRSPNGGCWHTIDWPEADFLIECRLPLPTFD